MFLIISSVRLGLRSRFRVKRTKKTMRASNAATPILNPMMELRLMWLCDFGVGGGFAEGMATMFSERPSSNLACETEKFECS